MAIGSSGSANLENRLALISKMLEEAVALLRNTMDEVKQEENGGRGDDHPDTAVRSR